MLLKRSVRTHNGGPGGFGATSVRLALEATNKGLETSQSDGLVLEASYFGLLASVVFSMQSATNALLAGAFILPFFLAFPTYQRYLEPSLVIAMFLFADLKTAKVLFNKRVLIYNFALTVLILAIGVAHYDLFNDLREIK